MILQRQVLQSCFDPKGGASAAVHRQSGQCTRWRASRAFLCCEQRQVPTVALFSLAFGVLQYIEKVVDVPGDAVVLRRLVKEFHTFVSGSHLTLCGATVHGGFLRISSSFCVKSGLRSSCSSHLEIGIISTSSIWQPPRASVYVAFGRISHIFIVLVVPESSRSSHLKIWTLFLLAVIWRWDGFFGGSDAFFALLQVVWSLAPVFGALDGEEFFAIECSCTIYPRRLLTCTFSLKDRVENSNNSNSNSTQQPTHNNSHRHNNNNHHKHHTQKVEQLLEVLGRLDIEVPKISQDSIRERLVDCDLRHPQMAEQLMEVQTVLSALLQQQYAEQTVARGRGLRGGIEGFLPGQSSTAPPFSEQIVDIPVPRGDLQGFLPGQGSIASSSSLVAANEAGHGGFSHFSPWKKVRSAGQVSADLPRHVSSWTPAAYEQPSGFHEEQLTLEEGPFCCWCRPPPATVPGHCVQSACGWGRHQRGRWKNVWRCVPSFRNYFRIRCWYIIGGEPGSRGRFSFRLEI